MRQAYRQHARSAGLHACATKPGQAGASPSESMLMFFNRQNYQQCIARRR